MKIAYIVPRFYPFKGGGEQNIFALASRMASNGHDVTIITTNIRFKKNEPLASYEMYKGMKVIRHWALDDQLYAGFYPSLLPYLLFNKFNIIHTSGIGFFWREICLIIKKIISPHTIFITTPHGPFMALGDKSGIRGFIKKYYTLVLKRLLPWLYNLIIEVNSKQNIWMTKEYNIPKNKILLIPNGIDKSYIETSIVEHSIKERIILTYMNRLEYYKGVQDVLKALFVMKSKRMEIPFFYIMGRPWGYSDTIYKMVSDLNLKDDIKFILYPSDEERDNIFYYKSQVNILPSKWEGTGITLIEAMAKGNVIITTTGNEASDILITENVNGFVYNFEDVDALVKILHNLLTNQDLIKLIRKNNIKKANKFTWENIFPLYEKSLIKLINNII